MTDDHPLDGTQQGGGVHSNQRSQIRRIAGILEREQRLPSGQNFFAAAQGRRGQRIGRRCPPHRRQVVDADPGRQCSAAAVAFGKACHPWLTLMITP
jgi:hypothetical protein